MSLRDHQRAMSEEEKEDGSLIANTLPVMLYTLPLLRIEEHLNRFIWT
jgi:hypothetical protein